MNERLKELYQQAHSIRRYDGDPSRAGNPPTVYWQGEVSAQRFAELIIRECYEWAKENGGLGSECDYDALKEHFGVEE